MALQLDNTIKTNSQFADPVAANVMSGKQAYLQNKSLTEGQMKSSNDQLAYTNEQANARQQAGFKQETDLTKYTQEQANTRQTRALNQATSQQELVGQQAQELAETNFQNSLYMYQIGKIDKKQMDRDAYAYDVKRAEFANEMLQENETVKFQREEYSKNKDREILSKYQDAAIGLQKNIFDFSKQQYADTEKRREINAKLQEDDRQANIKMKTILLAAITKASELYGGQDNLIKQLMVEDVKASKAANAEKKKMQSIVDAVKATDPNLDKTMQEFEEFMTKFKDGQPKPQQLGPLNPILDSDPAINNSILRDKKTGERAYENIDLSTVGGGEEAAAEVAKERQNLIDTTGIDPQAPKMPELPAATNMFEDTVSNISNMRSTSSTAMSASQMADFSNRIMQNKVTNPVEQKIDSVLNTFTGGSGITLADIESLDSVDSKLISKVADGSINRSHISFAYTALKTLGETLEKRLDDMGDKPANKTKANQLDKIIHKVQAATAKLDTASFLMQNKNKNVSQVMGLGVDIAKAQDLNSYKKEYMDAAKVLGLTAQQSALLQPTVWNEIQKMVNSYDTPLPDNEDNSVRSQMQSLITSFQPMLQEKMNESKELFPYMFE